MIKFEPDFASFGAIAGYINEDTPLSESIISYLNEAFINHYGNYEGTTILDFLSEVGGGPEQGHKLTERLSSEKELIIEDSLNNRHIKCHARIIDAANSQNNKTFFQIAVTDITEHSLLKKLYSNTSESLKKAAMAANEDTGHHITRINLYSQHLAVLLEKDKKFVERIAKYSQLHDIGKLKVNRIIKLDRELTDKEIAHMKNHTVFGAGLVKEIEGFDMAYNIALEHHEHYDGSGYPHGKKGKDISLEGRIVTVVDVFDALVSERPYKPAFSYEKTLDIMKNGDERVHPQHFDPDILKVFIEHYDDFVKIHEKWKQ
ncbi:MAG: HD domain-containing protein [Nitrospira sp.]|nr:HD domain-containing protein [Nitrospira sp.]